MKKMISSEGYFAGGALESGRTVSDYLLIVRDRIWYFVIVFSIVFISSVIYTLQETPIYCGVAKIKLLREMPKILPVDTVENTMIRNAEDFNTQIEVLDSMHLITAVASRIKGEDYDKLMAPYSGGQGMEVQEVLFRHREIQPRQSSLAVLIRYYHPDPDIAALVANYFADEYINHTIRESINTTMAATDNLRIRAGSQKAIVEQIRAGLGEYVKKYDSSSLKPEENIHLLQLQQISAQLSEDKRQLDLATIRLELIESAVRSGDSLVSIPFIAAQPLVTELRLRKAQQEIALAGLENRYREKHPSMVEMLCSYEQTKDEIDKAVAFTVQSAHKELEQTQKNYTQTEARLATKREELMAINELAIHYRTLEDDLRINSDLYLAMMARLQLAETNMNLVGPQARIIDRAVRPMTPDNSSVALNLSIGLLLGVCCGLCAVFGITMMNDRVKTLQDVEEHIGLPLIGVLPRIKRRSGSGKQTEAQMRLTESFRMIYSAMRLSDAGKQAKVILFTSTAPGEGRSFVMRNLAGTFASHGERTLMIDADLRMPSIGNSLGLKGGNGLIRYLAGECTLDEALTRAGQNLYVLPAGNAVINPTQVLSSHEFLALLKELSLQYDRIFIDTPPLAMVSDMMSLLPYADGIIYVIRCNVARMKSVCTNVRRLQVSQTPILGAIFNDISPSIANYHYASYYDKYFNKYYSAAGNVKARLKGQEEAHFVNPS